MGTVDADAAALRAPASEAPGAARSGIAVAYAVAAVAYLGWRATTLDFAHPVFSLVFYAAEIAGALGLALHLAVVRRLGVRTPPAVLEGLSVDVLVTALDEPLDMVRRTLLAARNMEYPHHTWLLDDTGRAELQALARDLGVRYIGRPEKPGSRAGNLNNALRFSRAGFVAVFDAHHAPARNFLTATLGHFRDARVGFVQTPLDSYNLDSFAHRRSRHGTRVWSEESVASRVVQRGRDCVNAAMLGASCAVIRRAALDHVRGFAGATLAAELHTSVRLHKAGWRSVYDSRPLAFGMAPASIGPWAGRYLRQAAGAIQMWQRERLVMSRQLTAGQKLAYLDAVLAHFVGWRKAIFYVTPIVVLTTGILPFDAPVNLFVAAFAAFHLLGSWVREEAGRGYADVWREEEYHMARFGVAIAATLAPLAGAALRRLPRVPAPGARGAAWPYMLPQAALLIASAVAVPAGIALHARGMVLAHDALVAAVVGAVLVGVLAARVLTFSAELATHRRRDYRFRVPVPARLVTEDGPLLGILDDVSPGGFRFYGPLPQRTALGTRLTGELFLPSGPTAFAAVVRAEIMAVGGGHVKGVGCTFEWNVATHRDSLERYLFGSDLQWTVNGLQDRWPTPLEQFSRWAASPTPAPIGHWAPALYEHAPNTLTPPQVGFVTAADAGDTRRLATLAPLDTRLPLRLRVVTRTGSHALVARAEMDRRVETAQNPVFLYRLAV
jgi:cellulose synthase (UDP-forming)